MHLLRQEDLREKEAVLFSSQIGSEILDALVQANLNLNSVSIEELQQMIRQMASARHQVAAPALASTH